MYLLRKYTWTGRYIAHLEAEVAALRSMLGMKQNLIGEKRPKGVDVPAHIVELCNRFETQGRRVLQELKRAHEKQGTPWEELARRVTAHIEANANGTGK